MSPGGLTECSPSSPCREKRELGEGRALARSGVQGWRWSRNVAPRARWDVCVSQQRSSCCASSSPRQSCRGSSLSPAGLSCRPPRAESQHLPGIPAEQRHGRDSGPHPPRCSLSRALRHGGRGAATRFISWCHRRRWVTRVDQGLTKLLSCRMQGPRP